MKTKFTVLYSEEKDLQTYLNLWNQKWLNYGQDRYELAKKHFPVEFLDNLKNASDQKNAKEVINNYWQQTRSKTFDQGSDMICKWFSRFLFEEQDQITGRLERLYGQKFPFSDITVYLNTYFSNPYNYEKLYYMVSRTANFWGLIGTSTHELNHFMFYFYFKDSLEKQNYSNTAIEHLKEAFAVLTSNNPSSENAEKIDVLPLQDFVYQNKDKPVEEIIELVIKNKLLENIK